MDEVLRRLRDEVARTRAQIAASRRARGVASPCAAERPSSPATQAAAAAADVNNDNNKATTTAAAATRREASAASVQATHPDGDAAAIAAPPLSSSPPAATTATTTTTTSDTAHLHTHDERTATWPVVLVAATRKEGLLWHLTTSSSSSNSSNGGGLASRLASLARSSLSLHEWTLHYVVADEASGISWYEPHRDDYDDDDTDDNNSNTTATTSSARHARPRKLLGTVPFSCITSNSRGSRFRRAAVCWPRLLPTDCAQASDATRAYFAVDYVVADGSNSSSSSSDRGGVVYERLVLAARSDAARDAWVRFLSKYIALYLPPEHAAQALLTRLPRAAVLPRHRSCVLDGEAPGARACARRPCRGDGQACVLRRLFAAPDDANELLATCNAGCLVCLTYTPAHAQQQQQQQQQDNDEDNDSKTAACASGRVGQLHVWDAAAHPRIALPSPARDVAWCPFKRGRAVVAATTSTTTNTTTTAAASAADDDARAVALVACTSQPLQLYDVRDGTLRASYVAHNASGAHCSPHAVAWPAAAGGCYIAAGYGEREDARQVRVYDVLVEGDAALWSYRSPSASCHSGDGGGGRDRAVTALCEGPSGLSNTTALLLCGFRAHSGVDVCDMRHRCCAALLRDDSSSSSKSAVSGGVSSVRVCASQPYAVYAGGRSGNDAVRCWDVRQPSRLLAQYVRHVHTAQVCDFVFATTSSSSSSSSSLRGCGRVLVSATTRGGLALFDLDDGNDDDDSHDAAMRWCTTRPVRTHLPSRHVGAEVGVTSGVAMLGDGCVAVVYGTRPYTFAATPHTTARRCHDDNNDNDDSDDSDAALLHYTGRTCVRAPLSDSDSDDEAAATATTRQHGNGNCANVTVLSLAAHA